LSLNSSVLDGNFDPTAFVTDNLLWIGVAIAVIVCSLVMVAWSGRAEGRKRRALENDLQALENRRSNAAIQSEKNHELYLTERANVGEAIAKAEYWRWFATLVLHDCRGRLRQMRTDLSMPIAKLTEGHIRETVANVDFVARMLNLAEQPDITRYLREYRRKTTHLIDAVVEIRGLVSKWRVDYGERIRATLPDEGTSAIVRGEWEHLELALSNVFTNAIKHGVSTGPIYVICMLKPGYVWFSISNLAVNPIPDVVATRSGYLRVDGRRRFGLFLTEKVVDGYEGHVGWRNLPPKAPHATPLVECSIGLPRDA
jgi:signal transduction histidine kinase